MLLEGLNIKNDLYLLTLCMCTAIMLTFNCLIQYCNCTSELPATNMTVCLVSFLCITTASSKVKTHVTLATPTSALHVGALSVFFFALRQQDSNFVSLCSGAVCLTARALFIPNVRE